MFLASGVKLFGIELLEREALESSAHKHNPAQKPLAKSALCAGEICSISPCIIACGDGARLLIKSCKPLVKIAWKPEHFCAQGDLG